jgi:hypothetical protein
MGYGITLLSSQLSLVNVMFKGDPTDSYSIFIADYVKDTVQRVAKVNMELARISYEAQDFLGNCHTLFNVMNPHEEDFCFYDNIYMWKRIYQNETLEWCDMLKIIEPLLSNYDDEIKIEIIEILEHLFDVIDITHTFVIS